MLNPARTPFLYTHTHPALPLKALHPVDAARGAAPPLVGARVPGDVLPAAVPAVELALLREGALLHLRPVAPFLLYHLPAAES